jgi:histidinol-phosphatase (PHP family)
MKIDSHMHPFEMKESLEGMREFVIIAHNNGFEEISFTEHGSLLPGRTVEFFQHYADCAMKLKEEISSPRINFGIELDYHPGKVDEAAAIIAKYPFDYVLGSVHVHCGLYSEEIKGMTFNEIADFALKMILEAVESELFDTITHFDFYRILAGTNDVHTPISHKNIILRIFQAMEKNGVCLEINSSSLRREINDLHPTSEILTWANDFNLKYTFGSDAHEAHLVGAGYNEAISALTASQRRKLVTHHNRKSVSCQVHNSINGI